MVVFVVISLVINALPKVSLKGPVGLSETATPIAFPLIVLCSVVMYQ